MKIVMICAVALGVVFVLLYSFFPFWTQKAYEPQIGDIVFQCSGSDQVVKLIRGITQSNISHCGIVVRRDGNWYVLEAGGFVEETELTDWVRNGTRLKFAAYRLRPEYRSVVSDFVSLAYEYLGKPYDDSFCFDEERIYCSELVYKAFKRATGEELGTVVTLAELNWRPFERAIEVYERGDVPLDREMITPRHLAEASQLEKVFSNGFLLAHAPRRLNRKVKVS